jgi:serine/threonine-protein kinase
MEGTTLEPGTVIEHRYVIGRFIGSGGIAEIYQAKHRVTGRLVALKIPRRDREADPAVHERLMREAQALSRVRHPGVIELVDAGQNGRVPYLVLELVEGRTLGGLLAARARLPWGEVVALGGHIAEIVGHCHDRSVVHRDLKPDNVFSTPASRGPVKLFDFGIARLLDLPGDAPAQKLTQVGSIVGTPEYMAPEALELDADQDHRVDIYGLGVMLFELLTGSVPFEGRYAEVLVQVTTKPLPSLAELRPDAPAELVQVIERCLAKKALDRFQSMAELRSALSAVPVGRAGATAPMPDMKHTIADSPVAISGRAPAVQAEQIEATAVPSPRRPEAPAVMGAATGKRRFPRAPYTTPAQLTLASGTVVGQVEEISEGGVQFISSASVPSGERGEFRFAEPITGRIFKITAVSRWTKAGRAGRHATGFEFEDAPEEARGSIRKYVSLMGGS